MPESSPLFPRLLQPTIQAALKDTPVVCVLGPRQSGKTTLVQQLEPERAFFDLDDAGVRKTAVSDPFGFIRSLPEAVTLDEIQQAPELMSAIKLEVDKDQRPGRFLLTGSANLLLLPSVSESLAGRVEFADLQPLTEAEKGRRPGHFLKTLLTGGFKPFSGTDTLPEGPSLAERLVTGGYPRALGRTPARIREWHRNYVRSIINRDVPDIAQIRKGDRLLDLLEFFVNPNAQLLNSSNLAQSIGLTRATVDSYTSILQRLYLLRRLPAWHSSAARRLARSPKIHLFDSGLAASLAGLSTDDWISRRNLMGRLLESFVVQQLVAQAGWTDQSLRFWHYRDNNQAEVDLVMSQGRKVWGIEVKAGSEPGRRDGRGLARLAQKCGEDFQSGIVLYNGEHTLPMPDKRMLAVPLHQLWTR